MSKKPTRPPQRPAPAEPDDIDLALIDVAEAILSEHFFDPDAEDEYKRKHALNRGRQEATLLFEDAVEVFDEECAIRVEGLRTWTRMRVTLRHPEFGAMVEGMWSFDTQELRKPEVAQRSGEPGTIREGVEELLDTLMGSISDEDLMDSLEHRDDDDEPLIGDDPREPPPATGADRSRVKAIAKRLVRDHGEINLEDRSWMEQTPQVLPVLTDLLIDMAATALEDDPMAAACLGLLEAALEFVRYRQDRGWDWAIAMLDDFQRKLLAFGRAGTNQGLFLAMSAAMTHARVPVGEEMRQAFAEAGLNEAVSEPSGELDSALDNVLAELAEAADSPFDVIASLSDTGAVMPASLRGFLAAKLAGSEHEVIRDAAALLLLDEDASVREATVAALAGAASTRVSPETLRRAVTIRNWVPEAERAGIDALVRSAREAGVPIASWPEGATDTECHATMIDGSAAQSILMVSRMGKKFLFNALLIRHGTGVVDVWSDPGLSRTKVQRLLKEAQRAVPSCRVPREFVDALVRHALGASAGRGGTPPAGLLQVAEDIRAPDWRAQRLDLVAEVERRIAGTALPNDVQDDAAVWLRTAETLGSWYEEGPDVHAVLSRLPRNRRPALVDAVLTDILPARRIVWAERFVLMGLWCEAAEEVAYRGKAQAMLAVADALLSDVPMQDIPAMWVIANQTVTNELVTPW